jgi:hypothetical protein
MKGLAITVASVLMRRTAPRCSMFVPVPIRLSDGRLLHTVVVWRWWQFRWVRSRLGLSAAEPRVITRIVRGSEQ